MHIYYVSIKKQKKNAFNKFFFFLTWKERRKRKEEGKGEGAEERGRGRGRWEREREEIVLRNVGNKEMGASSSSPGPSVTLLSMKTKM